jgi:ferritin-like metal-binding protein YciE
MTVKNPKELFLFTLSDVRYGAELSNKFFRELAKLAQEPDMKEALEARIFVSTQTIETLDKCFEILGEKPVKVNGQVYDIFVENFRKDFADIQTPAAKRLFILYKVCALVHLRIGEYKAMIATADWTGHYNIGLLLESCLADHLAFVERMRRLIHDQIREKVTAV